MSSVKTKKLIIREYYWLSVNAVVKRYCQTCQPCAMCKDPSRKNTIDSTITGQPTEPWQDISMDLKGPFGSHQTNNGNRYLLVILDLFTRAAEMIPIPNKTAKTVANAVITEVFCRHGIPESILTDRGLEFDNSAISVLASELGIDKKRISPLHPQANGAVERRHWGMIASGI
jgi:transposase InsO family protein